MEAPTTGSDPTEQGAGAIAERLGRIEAAVSSGHADLGAIGFWQVVGRVKRDRALIDAHADQIGRIDRMAFRAFVGRWRMSAALGTAILVVGAIVGLAAAIAGTIVDDEVWAGVLLIAAGGIWTVALHSPAHHLVGALVGIRFTDYFIGGPPPPRPGIKTDYATYLRADPNARAWMHASGALATKVAPFLALLFVPASSASAWAAVVLVAIGALQIVSDVLFSVRTSDWKKVRRERAVARALATGDASRR